MTTPHPLNSPGDFYVEDGCCMSCGMPTTEAPDLFAYVEGGGHCYVRKQPVTPEEHDQMVAAFRVQDVGCIRYKGTNRIIQIRLIDTGEGPQCDDLDMELADRNHKVQAAREEAREAVRAEERAAAKARILAARSNSLWARFVRWILAEPSC